MNETMLMLLGVSAGALNFAGMVPYVRDMFRGTTKPDRATWWLWLLNNSISLASSLHRNKVYLGTCNYCGNAFGVFCWVI